MTKTNSFNYIFQLFALASLIAGCTIGGNITESPVANNPGGDMLNIRLDDNRNFLGEFLTLNKQSIIVLVDKSNAPISDTNSKSSLPMITEISLYKIQSAELINAEKMMMEEGKLTNEIDQKRLKFYSRYPQGMDSELIDRLLKAYRQNSLMIVDK